MSAEEQAYFLLAFALMLLPCILFAAERYKPEGSDYDGV